MPRTATPKPEEAPQESVKTFRQVWEEGRQVGLIQARQGYFYGMAEANPYPEED